MHRSLQFVLFLLAICMVARGQDKPAPISLKELIADLAPSETAIRDIDVVQTQEKFAWQGDLQAGPRTPSPDGGFRVQYKLKGTLKGREMEYTRTAELRPGTQGDVLPAYTAFNGEFLTWYTPQSRTGMIAASRDRMPLFQPAALMCRYFNDGEDFRPLSEFLSDIAAGKGYEKVWGIWVCEAEIVTGVWAYPVLMADSNPATGRYGKIWVAPKYGFSVVRLEFGNASRQPSVQEFSELTGYSEVTHGVWFPREILSCDLRGDRDACRFLVESVRVNSGLPDSDFTLQFPAGTDVEDERTNTQFVVPAASDGPPPKERFGR